MRARCPACIADERKESPGNALVFGLILGAAEGMGAKKRKLCGRHTRLAAKEEVEVMSDALCPIAREEPGEEAMRSDEYWRCWICGAMHHYRMTRCPMWKS